MAVSLASVIIPVYNQAESIGSILEQYMAAFPSLGFPCELLVVVNGLRRDQSLEICKAVEARHANLRTLVIDQGGWGRAVRHGLANAQGDLICYTNCARTTAPDLIRLLGEAARNPDSVIKARRMERESLRRRVGSAIYNLESRVLFGVKWPDVNATPKIFPRAFTPLLQLEENGDLIDLEFNALCRRLGYPVLEVPIFTKPSAERKSTTGWKSAWRMYTGAVRLRWSWLNR